MPRHSKTKAHHRRANHRPKESRSRVQDRTALTINFLLTNGEDKEVSKPSTASDLCSQLKAFTSYIMTSSGIKTSVVRALVCLYEETHKPDDAVGYMTCLLGADLPSEDYVREMQAKVQELRDKIEKLEDHNVELRDKLQDYEATARNSLLSPETLGEYEEHEEYPSTIAVVENLGAGVNLEHCHSFTNFSW